MQDKESMKKRPLQEMFEGMEVEPERDLWRGIHAAIEPVPLETNRRKKWGFYVAIAASIVLLIAAGIFFFPQELLESEGPIAQEQLNTNQNAQSLAELGEEKPPKNPEEEAVVSASDRIIAMIETVLPKAEPKSSKPKEEKQDDEIAKMIASQVVEEAQLPPKAESSEEEPPVKEDVEAKPPIEVEPQIAAIEPEQPALEPQETNLPSTQIPVQKASYRPTRKAQINLSEPDAKEVALATTQAIGKVINIPLEVEHQESQTQESWTFKLSFKNFKVVRKQHKPKTQQNKL